VNILLEVYRSLIYHRVDQVSFQQEQLAFVDNDDLLRDTTEKSEINIFRVSSVKIENA
jgi:hypothetical protein